MTDIYPDNFEINLFDYIVNNSNNYKYNTKCKSIITSSYKLGYIFGTFLNNNILNQNYKHMRVHSWILDNNNIAYSKKYNISKKIKNYMYDIFGYTCDIVADGNNNHISINCYLLSFINLLQEFYNNINNNITINLPHKYYCNNKHYIQGLFDGIIDINDYHIHKNNFELFYWCCYNI